MYTVSLYSFSTNKNTYIYEQERGLGKIYHIFLEEIKTSNISQLSVERTTVHRVLSQKLLEGVQEKQKPILTGFPALV